ncbi:10141_t:CDS:2, partial [Entrophospora sp. SA101]
SKIREAIKFLSEGDKATEKNWFKKPEWDIAGQRYEKAASSFKAARSYEQAIQAYQKASDALFKSDSLYMSAKAMESSANLASQQLKQPERAAEMYKKASDLYLAHMVPDRAGEMLEKGARALEPVNVDGAIEMYMAACTLFETEERGRFAIDTFKRTIAIMIRNKRFELATEILHRLNAIYTDSNNQQGINKTCLKESAIASFLLDAFEQGDQELLEQAVRRQVVTFLDNEVVRLARSLQVPGASHWPPPSHSSQLQQPPPILSQQDQSFKSQSHQQLNNQVPHGHQQLNNQTNIGTPNENIVEEEDEEGIC